MKTYTLETLAYEEGTASALERLLSRKFGKEVMELEWVKEKLKSAVQEDLDQWLEQILDARTPEDVFA